MLRTILGATTVLVAAAALSPAFASSHREAPGITELPKLDGTDFYMFRSYEPGRAGFVTMIANYQPLQGQAGGPTFFTMDPNAVYDIFISNDGGPNPNLTFAFQFTNTDKNIALNVGGKSVPVGLADVGPIGTNGNPKDTANLNVAETYTLSVIRNGVAEPVTNAATGSAVFTKPVDYIGKKTLNDYEAYAKNFVYDVKIPGCATPGRVFAGQRAESFFIDLSETFDLINYGHPIGEQFANSGHNDIGGFNISSLEIEVPASCLLGPTKDPVIGAWTDSFSIVPAAGGGTTKVEQSRLGMPLFNELLVGLKDKDKWNASKPKDDAQFLTYVEYPTVPAIVQAVFGSAGVKAPTNFPRKDLFATYYTGIAGINQPKNVFPSEMLRLNTSTPVVARGKQNRLGVIGGDKAGFPNGRRPGDDIVDVTLRVAMGRLCTLGVNGYCTKGQAPSGALDFTDGAELTSANFGAAFPYLNTPQAGSPNSH